MLVILFRSRLSAEAGEDYQDKAAEMLAYARAQPGYVDFKQYQAEDGERLTVVKWKDRETLEAWRQNPRHREAKHLGREHWYASYDIEIAEVIHENHFERAGVSL
jgi:heme-degrading monooxygenase HmoA